MTITVEAENVYDAQQKLGPRSPSGDVRIRWRGADFGRGPLPGCIVDATSVQGEEVPRMFNTAGEALRYLRNILERRDAFVKQQKQESLLQKKKLLKANKK